MKFETTHVSEFRTMVKSFGDVFTDCKLIKVKDECMLCGISQDRVTIFNIRLQPKFFDKGLDGDDIELGMSMVDSAKVLTRFNGSDSVEVSTDGKRTNFISSEKGKKKRLTLFNYIAKQLEGFDLSYVNGRISDVLTNAKVKFDVDREFFVETIDDSRDLSSKIKITGSLETKSIYFKTVTDSGDLEYTRDRVIDDGEFLVGAMSRMYDLEILQSFNKANWLDKAKIYMGNTSMLLSASINDLASISLIMSSFVE